MTKNYQVIVDRAIDAKAAEVLLIPGNKIEPVRVQAQPGATYTLSDKASDKAPQQIYAKRQGKHLHLQLDVQRPGEAPDLILENFYEVSPGNITGLAEDASTYRFIPNTAQEFDQLSLLADGSSASQVLGGSLFLGGSGAGLLVASAPLVGVAGLALGPAGMAAAGLAGLAALAGGGGGGGGGSNGNSGPGVSNNPFTSALLPGEDTGSSTTDNITSKNKPKLGGKGVPGSKVSIQVDGGTPQEVTVDALGNWSWTPDEALADGRHTIIATSVDAAGTVVRSTLNLQVDTNNITGAFGSNFSAINTEPVGSIDTKLNIKESKNGVLLTIELDEPPVQDLKITDLILTGGILRSASFAKVANTNKYTVLADPTPNTAGNLTLKWSPAGQAITDVAGNPLDEATTQQLFVPYDTLSPQVSIFGGNTSVQVPANNQNLSIEWVNPSPNDLKSVTVSLLGQTISKNIDASQSTSSLALSSTGEGLVRLIEGYYTLGTTFTDLADNSTSQKTVLIVNRGTLQLDSWGAAATSPPDGDSNNNLFINRAGNQTFKGGSAANIGGSDTYVWLSRDAGAAGRADTDRIIDFKIGADGQGDKLDIKDLLGANIAFANLPKYVQVSTFDSDNNNIADSTRLSISSAGAFNGSLNAENLTDQVIVLQAVVTDLNSLLDFNLVWEARGGPILA